MLRWKSGILRHCEASSSRSNPDCRLGFFFGWIAALALLARNDTRWRNFIYIVCICFFSFATIAHAAAPAPHFPTLTGHVVDDAHLLSPSKAEALGEQLAQYEQGTTNQVVVVTLPSLQGLAIEDYGYRLGRFWGIGQKGKNNGVLLIVAPKERKVRIEVGYGLEPVLTDAVSSQIVQGIMVPAFRAGNNEQGIVEGTDAILKILGGESLSAGGQKMTTHSSGQSIIGLLFFVLFLYFAIRHPFIALLLLSNNSRYGSSSVGSSWGGGGGGSFGGGGSSGSW